MTLSYLFNAPCDERHELEEIIEAVCWPKIQSFYVATNSSQTHLSSQMIQHILKAHVVVVFGTCQCAIVDEEIFPNSWQVEGAIPVLTDLRGEDVYQRMESISFWEGDLPDWHSSALEHPIMRIFPPAKGLGDCSSLRIHGLDHLPPRQCQCKRLKMGGLVEQIHSF